MSSEKRWIVFFFFVEAIWLIILSSLIYQWIYGIEVLVDTDLNLFYVTMPLLGLSLVYNFTSIFVFFIYIIASNRVKTYQIQKLQSKRQVIKKHVINTSSANVIRNPVFNSKNED